MRFTTAFVAGLFAVAYAQETTIDSTSSSEDVATPTVSIDPVQESILNCLENCADGDVDCEAKCVPVPNPSEEMISANDQCIANCPKGNGTEADIAAYSSCQAGCIASYYYTSTVGGVATGGANPTDSSDGADSTGDADSESDSDNSDDSADSEEASDSEGGDSGAGVLGVSSAAFGLAAFLAAFAVL